MKESINIWGIKEHESNGASCPITPVNLPFYKKILLFFFRFGVCPTCMTLSVGYNILKLLKKMVVKLKGQGSLTTEKSRHTTRQTSKD